MSPYIKLYNILIPKDHELRLILELTGSESVYEELKDNLLFSRWSEWKTIDPIRMFKFLLLNILLKI
ncbi:hypothetical protein CBF27_01090 [Vagococcus acidifermentans]|uniref:Uncharacterized protein n=1 Tax=Vagococcus acidifermentans TaxID=564710 RepID=A0A430B2S9_9ENTE|nr:hypothetical protein CBF27_01090 [Vagococcus acidifermentans]